MSDYTCPECDTEYDTDKHEDECPRCRADDIIHNSHPDVVEYLKDDLMYAGESAVRPMIRQVMDANGEVYTARFHKSFNKTAMADESGEIFMVLARKAPHEYVVNPASPMGEFGPCLVCGFRKSHDIHATKPTLELIGH